MARVFQVHIDMRTLHWIKRTCTFDTGTQQLLHKISLHILYIHCIYDIPFVSDLHCLGEGAGTRGTQKIHLHYQGQNDILS